MLDGASSNSTAEVSMQQNQLAKQQKSSNPHNSLNSKQDDYWQSEDSRSDSITSDNEISNALIKSPVESDDELHWPQFSDFFNNDDNNNDKKTN